MKTFSYRAKRGPHEWVDGKCEAESQDEVVEKMTRNGLFPVEVVEISEVQRSPDLIRLRKNSGRKIPGKEIIAFYRHLERLVRSGVPILKALALLKTQLRNPALGHVIESIQNFIREGSSLTDALERCGGVFPEFDQAIIKAGEASGELEGALLRLISHKERMERLGSKILISLAYPALVLAIGGATSLWLLVYVIPQFAVLFENAGEKLPWLTQGLVSFSQFCGKNPWAVLGCLGSFGVVSVGMTRLLAKKDEVQSFFLRIPFAGEAVLKYEVIQFTQTLAILLKNGVPALRAVTMASLSVRVPFVRKLFLKSETFLREGSFLSDSLRTYSHWPPFFVEMIQVGEASGRLDESLAEIADAYEEDLKRAIELGTSLLEPLLILGIGGVLGMIILALLLPILNLDQALVPG